jgi:hypothetical protein
MNNIRGNKFLRYLSPTRSAFIWVNLFHPLCPYRVKCYNPGVNQAEIYCRKFELDMKQRRIILSMALVLTSLLCASLSMSCSKKINALPFIPPSYYGAIAVNAHQLLQAYYPSYTDEPIYMGAVEFMYDGKIFIFKSVKVTKYMIDNSSEGYVWIDLIKCYPMEVSALSGIKVGDTVDVVGVNAGLCPDFAGALKFSDCFFLPSGSVQIPAPGSDTFAPLY